MNKKRVIGAGICLLVIAVVIGAIGVTRHVKEVKRLQHEQEKENNSRLLTYAGHLHIEGDMSIENGTVVIDNKKFIEVRLVEDICLHNEFYGDNVVTEEVLLEEFDMFCNTLEESEILSRYCEETHDAFRECADAQVIIHYNDYYIRIMHKLDADDYKVTLEQAKAAAEEVAKELHDEMEK